MKNLFGMLLLFLSIISFVSCSSDDELGDPEGSVTLNMMNEGNGKTLLGASDVYINKSNNFKTSSCFIANMGESYGLGAPTNTILNNLVQETAVVPKYTYHIYDKNFIRNFPSGNKAIMIGSGYYKAYVMTPIQKENTTTGAILKYVLTYPETNNLPEYDKIIGNVDNIGDRIEYTLPEDAELLFSDYLDDEKNAFDIQITSEKLEITLLESINQISGPYGDYGIYVRSGSTFSYIEFQAGVKNQG